MSGRGGKRPGAGRKASALAKSRTIRLTESDWALFKSLGGPAWLRAQLRGNAAEELRAALGWPNGISNGPLPWRELLRLTCQLRSTS